MGKVEKVIVLSVLFLVTLILVVSVTMDDPLDKTKVVEAGGGKKSPLLVAQAPQPAPQPGSATAQNPNPLLSANVNPTTPPVTVPPSAAAGTQSGSMVPQGTSVLPPAAANATSAATVSSGKSMAVGLPAGALLQTLDGLENSYFDAFKLYTWREGDNWRALAVRYYDDWKYVDLLKRNNEDRMDVAPGEKVLIPVFAEDGAAVAALPTNTTPNARPIEAGASTASKGAAKPASAPAATPTGKKIHTVASGESLWKIAKAELGDGNRWKEIYEANRDVLAKPESIKKGMRLRIP